MNEFGTSRGVAGRPLRSTGRAAFAEHVATFVGEMSTRVVAVFHPVWLLICRRGAARLGEVCRRGCAAVGSPAAVLGVELPPLFDVHQVPKVLRVEAGLAVPRHELCERLLHVAAAGVHAAGVRVPFDLLRGAHLQRHVVRVAPHLLLPRLRRAQPLQPGHRDLLRLLRDARRLAERLAASTLCAHRRGQQLALHQPRLLLTLLLCCGGRCSPSEALLSHFYQVTFALLTCFLFTSHLPERLAPGRFDYFGHSHQLFHVSAVVATHFQLGAVLSDMTSRRGRLEATGAPPSLPGTAGAVALGLVLNLGVVALFVAPLLRRSPRRPAPNHGKDQ
ncbi:uncharacterized protein paqr6 isoform X5 [Phyllopteryx taeniolatus]|uniref:uncharacterized protein paqr6 isoform X5 n=1 Tax=Phyllopteryx taeniolatus TaxID=161469 RepID=UPI002AD54846|nr:uncharacterized protein paqr6 isoform X5 [Phyllopteryx taeniolatus]